MARFGRRRGARPAGTRGARARRARRRPPKRAAGGWQPGCSRSRSPSPHPGAGPRSHRPARLGGDLLSPGGGGASGARGLAFAPRGRRHHRLRRAAGTAGCRPASGRAGAHRLDRGAGPAAGRRAGRGGFALRFARRPAHGRRPPSADRRQRAPAGGPGSAAGVVRLRRQRRRHPAGHRALRSGVPPACRARRAEPGPAGRGGGDPRPSRDRIRPRREPTPDRSRPLHLRHRPDPAGSLRRRAAALRLGSKPLAPSRCRLPAGPGHPPERERGRRPSGAPPGGGRPPQGPRSLGHGPLFDRRSPDRSGGRRLGSGGLPPGGHPLPQHHLRTAGGLSGGGDRLPRPGLLHRRARVRPSGPGGCPGRRDGRGPLLGRAGPCRGRRLGRGSAAVDRGPDSGAGYLLRLARGPASRDPGLELRPRRPDARHRVPGAGTPARHGSDSARSPGRGRLRGRRVRRPCRLQRRRHPGDRPCPGAGPAVRPSGSLGLQGAGLEPARRSGAGRAAPPAPLPLRARGRSGQRRTGPVPRGGADPPGIGLRPGCPLRRRCPRADAAAARPSAAASPGAPRSPNGIRSCSTSPTSTSTSGSSTSPTPSAGSSGPKRALAAYNAGVDRVERWQSIRGVGDDPEIFVERIPFAETRDYVRKVLRNYAMYAALYGSRPT